MENTLQIIETNGIQTVSARELYKGLEITDRFNRWFESLLKYGFEENLDFRCVKTSTQQNQYGGIKEIDDYSITLDMAKQICMLQRSELGKKYRTYLINLEKAWNEPDAVMARALEIAHKTLADCQKQVAIMQPKADVYDKICNSETLKPVDQVASNLGYGKNNFFALMRGMGIFYYSSKDAEGKKVNLPKQEYKDRGYFVTKEEPYSRGDKDCLYTKIYVTGKGETWLTKKLTEDVAESFIEKGAIKQAEKSLDGDFPEIVKNNVPGALEKVKESIKSNPSFLGRDE